MPPLWIKQAQWVRLLKIVLCYFQQCLLMIHAIPLHLQILAKIMVVTSIKLGKKETRLPINLSQVYVLACQKNFLLRACLQMLQSL